MNALEMEILVSRLFRPRQNLIIPNVSWGFGVHECDLLIVSGTGYLTEIEIKISVADLKKDADKGHGHKSHKIRKLYFAVPDSLGDVSKFIPEQAGTITVYPNRVREITENGGKFMNWAEAKITKPGLTNKMAKPITDIERLQLARLGCLRIWGLKEKILMNQKNGGNK